jgi:peptide chain release factor 2
MHDLNQKVKELMDSLREVKKLYKPKEKEVELKKLESETLTEDFWDDQARARGVMKDFEHLKKEIDDFRDLEEDISTLWGLSQEGELSQDLEKDVKAVDKSLKKFKLVTFLGGANDPKNAILSIHAGQGGTEAMDWTSMLYRMYLRYCEKRGWKTDVVDMSEGEEAGIKSVTIAVEGAYAYGYLKGESGTHRLVRQSPFNADKLRQTSFALVEVLPELEEKDMPELSLSDDDLEWQFFRASSQGGQNVQKVSTAVRLKHIPTGIVVTAQTERYQEANRKIALNLLRAKLWAREQAMQEAKIEKIKGEYRPPSWGNQIRSYVLHPYKMVKDLRTNVETSDTEAVLDGDLDEFVEAEIQKL